MVVFTAKTKDDIEDVFVVVCYPLVFGVAVVVWIEARAKDGRHNVEITVSGEVMRYLLTLCDASENA